MVNRSRRDALRRVGASGALFAAFAAGVIRPSPALAARNQSAFDAQTMAEAMRSLGIAGTVESQDIQIKAPEIAENGAVVPIEITSTIPGTQSISVFIEKNPFPYTGTFDVSQGALPFVALRVKVGESSAVRVVVAAGGKYYAAAKEVKVTIGGCGG